MNALSPHVPSVESQPTSEATSSSETKGTTWARTRALKSLRVTAALLGLFAALAPIAAAQGRPDIVWFGPGHININTVAVSPDGQTIASASTGDHTVKLWRTSDGTLLRTLPAQLGECWPV